MGMGLLIDLVVNAMYVFTFGNPQIMGLAFLGLISYIVFRTHMDRGGIALVASLTLGLFAWAGWIPFWFYGIVLIIGAIVVAYSVLRFGGDGQ
jgi:CHASE2 domain-containing sensor protein